MALALDLILGCPVQVRSRQNGVAADLSGGGPRHASASTSARSVLPRLQALTSASPLLATLRDGVPQAEKRAPVTSHDAQSLRKLASDGRLLELADLASALVDAGVSQAAVVGAVAMGEVQAACGLLLREGRLDEVTSVLRRLRAAGFVALKCLGNESVNLIAQQFRQMLQRDEVDECVRLLTALSDCGVPVKRLMDVRTVVTACAKSGNLTAALKYARLLPKVNLHYNCIMHEFGRHGDLESVFTAFDSMEEAGIQADMFSYRSILDACALRKEIARATSVFHAIFSSGSLPNVYVYNSFMNVCAEDTDTVWQLYADMQRFSVEPDLTTFNVMLKSCSLSKSLDRAISLYEDMQSRATSGSLKLDVFTYTTIIHIFGEARLWELALKVKDDIIASGVAPNVMTWSALIGACANSRIVDHAFSLYHEMCNAGCRPNEQTHNMLINACCKAGQHERAFQVFREWNLTGRISAYGQSDQRTSVAESKVARAQVGLQHPDGTFSKPDIDLETSSRGIISSKPDLVTYNTLMKSCSDDPLLVEEIIEYVMSVGLSPDLTSWSTCIDAFGSKGRLQEALAMFETMKVKGVTPDVVVYTSVIKACVEAGDGDKAFEYFSQMKEAGLRPNKVTFQTLLRLQRTRQPLHEIQRALALYEEMREAGYAPNDIILRVLLAQWAEGAIDGVDRDSKTARCSLQFQNEVSAEYSRLLLHKAAVHSRMPEAEPNLTIDLHGLSRGEARVAVLAVLRIIKERHVQGYRVNDDLVIITGVGLRSEVPGQSIVRQAVLHVLEHDLGLPVACGAPKIHVRRKGFHMMASSDGSQVGAFTKESQRGRLLENDGGAVDDLSSRALDCGSNSSPTGLQPELTMEMGPVWSQGESIAKVSVSGPSVFGQDDQNDAFVVRKPTNFGRLIVSKRSLHEWLSRKRGGQVRSISTTKTLAR